MDNLAAENEIVVRFSEVDMLTIVWHGNYVQYLEEGRFAFGLKYGLGYMDVYREGYTIPIVKLNIDYKSSLKFHDTLIVKVQYVPIEAAKIVFRYQILNKNSNQIVATAETVQVFVDCDGNLCITSPAFFSAWKEKWLGIKSEP